MIICCSEVGHKLLKTQAMWSVMTNRLSVNSLTVNTKKIPVMENMAGISF